MKRYWVVIILAYLAANIIFNNRLWQEAVTPNPPSRTFGGEPIIIEYQAETIYKNLLSLKNPFESTYNIFYPHETNFALTDSGASNGFYFIFLRPFFTVHQSLMMIVVTSIFAANIGMYLLLCKLGVGRSTAFLFGLVFGFTPYISWRIIGHYTLTNIYLFPWLFLTAYTLITTNNFTKKLITAAGLGTLAVVTLWTSLLYSLSAALLAFFYLIYFLLFRRREASSMLLKNGKYFVFSAILASVLLIPWFLTVFKVIYFNGLVGTPGFGGAITLSADLIGFFTPSRFNPFYSFITHALSPLSDLTARFEEFFLARDRGFAYFGVILLAIYGYLALNWKKIPLKLSQAIKPHFIISLLFLLLALGPFLKIFNKWFWIVDEGVRIVIPLPHLLFSYIPILEMSRAPDRFIPAFVFIASIVGAFVVDYFISKRFKKSRNIVIFILLAIFLVDQFYIILPRIGGTGPGQIYAQIKSDPEYSTVLEIPFTVRDGLQYAGFVHAIGPMNGQLIHGKPIIGGYLGRVYPYVFDYYRSLPFINSLAVRINKGNYNPAFEAPHENSLATRPISVDVDQATKEVNFLNIKYIMLKSDEEYSGNIKNFISQIGFVPQFNDGVYTLFTRGLELVEFDKVDVGSTGDDLHLSQGFSVRDEDFRWVDGKIAKVMFKINKINHSNLKFTAASFHQSQTVKVYLNNEFIDEILFGVEFEEYSLPVSYQLKTGINYITFKFSNPQKPSRIYAGSQDNRDLSAKFSYIGLE